MPEENTQDTNQVVEEVNTGVQEQQEDLSPSENPAEAELPENAKERTKEQFEKLKKHNDELKKQLEEREKLPSVLDMVGQQPQINEDLLRKYQQPQQQPQQEEKPESLVDDDGYVNANVLQKELELAKQARLRAEEAEKRAREAQDRISRFEQNQEQERLYKEYPELDPMNENFNRDAYELVRNELTSQIVQTGKRNALEAASKMSRFFRNNTPQPQKPSVEEQRVQAVNNSAGNQPRQQANSDLDQLKLRSRNDPNAVYERLKRLGL